ncbi:MAG: hypothetical protein AB7F28_04100 [Candidatus Margulisiibacteriota bacterium]
MKKLVSVSSSHRTLLRFPSSVSELKQAGQAVHDELNGFSAKALFYPLFLLYVVKVQKQPFKEALKAMLLPVVGEQIARFILGHILIALKGGNTTQEIEDQNAKKIYWGIKTGWKLWRHTTSVMSSIAVGMGVSRLAEKWGLSEKLRKLVSGFVYHVLNRIFEPLLEKWSLGMLLKILVMGPKKAIGLHRSKQG